MGEKGIQGIRYFDGPFSDRKMDDGKWLLSNTNLYLKVFRGKELGVNYKYNLLSYKEILLTCFTNAVFNVINTLSM